MLKEFHKKDVRDNFHTEQAVCSKLKMCIAASLPHRLCARSLCKEDACVCVCVTVY